MPRVNVSMSDEDFAALRELAELRAGGNLSLMVRRLIEPELAKVRALQAAQPSLFEGPGHGGGAADTRTRRGPGRAGGR